MDNLCVRPFGGPVAQGEGQQLGHLPPVAADDVVAIGRLAVGGRGGDGSRDSRRDDRLPLVQATFVDLQGQGSQRSQVVAGPHLRRVGLQVLDGCGWHGNTPF
ncbi:MAG: hypothetical protein IPM39_09475 [Chloroflexi bacterium]|nr:hypothetical protein [Chloroflexota bacterium]